MGWSRYWLQKILFRDCCQISLIPNRAHHQATVMYKKAHSSSTLNNKTGVLSTPYASRTNMARIGTDYPKSLNRTMAWRKTYFSLSDPHLTRYFQNKLLASFDRESSSRPSSCLSTPRSRASTVTGKFMWRVYESLSTVNYLQMFFHCLRKVTKNFLRENSFPTLTHTANICGMFDIDENIIHENF